MTKFLVLDLEMNQPSNDIIQAGWCVWDTVTQKSLESKSFYVFTPDSIDPFITELTGITDKDISDNAISLWNVVSLMLADHKAHKCWINPVVWGHGDVKAIDAQLERQGAAGSDARKALRKAFGRRIIDVKTFAVMDSIANGNKIAGGLGEYLTRYGLQFDGRAHDAGADAFNTARIFQHFLNKAKDNK